MPDYDMVVIGGGLLAAAAARDAALRGLSVALFAPEDFGAAEGRLGRLAPGSLGALETLDFTRVREDSREREILLQTAPDFVQSQPCLVPFYSSGLLAQARLRAGLALTDALGFDPLQNFDPASLQFDPPLRVHQILSAAQARRQTPGLSPAGLTGAARVWEARVDHPARLALATALDARRHGAVLHSHTAVDELLQESGPSGRTRVSGLRWTDRLSGTSGRTTAALVLIADHWDDHFELAGAGPRLIRSVSVSVSAPVSSRDALALPGSGALCYLVPGASGSVPGSCFLGPFESVASEACPPAYATAAEVAALLDAVRPSLPGLAFEAVQSAEVRLRASVVPGREVSDPSADGGRLDGQLTVSGSTLTTARRLAEDAIDLACRKLGRSLAVPSCRTAVTPLLPLVDTSALPLPAAVETAVHDEDCRTLRDFLLRRPVPSDPNAAALPLVLETLASQLGWDTARQARELKDWQTAEALPQTFRVV